MRVLRGRRHCLGASAADRSAVMQCTADGLSICANSSEELRGLGTVIAGLTGTVAVVELE